MTQNDRVYSISGQVVGERGGAVGEANVVATLADSDGTQVLRESYTDNDGGFVVELVVPDTWAEPSTTEPWNLRLIVIHHASNRGAWPSFELSTTGRSLELSDPIVLHAMRTGTRLSPRGSDTTVRIEEAIIDFATPLSGGGGGGGGGGTAFDVDETIDAEFQRLLGRSLDTDDPATTTAVFDQLRRNFRQVPTDDGSFDYEFDTSALPSAFSQPEIDTPMTGEQAVIVESARSGFKDAKRRLESLEAPIPALDHRDASAAQLVAIALLEDLVDQLGYQIPPNVPRVTELFGLLHTQLERIAAIYGFDDIDNIDLLEKDEQSTRLGLVTAYVRGLEVTWHEFLAKRDEPSLGTRLVVVQRGLQGVADAVAEVYRKLDASGLGAGLRRTLTIDFRAGSDPPSMLIQDLLGWPETWTPGARKIVRGAGAQGLAVVQSTAERIETLVRAAADHGEVPHDAWTRPPVTRALHNLADALDEVAQLADTGSAGGSGTSYTGGNGGGGSGSGLRPRGGPGSPRSTDSAFADALRPAKPRPARRRTPAAPSAEQSV